MSKLTTLNGLNNDELLDSIFSEEIIVFEDVQGSKIWVNWNGEKFSIKPKSVSGNKYGRFGYAELL
jgi:ketopantoate reductase